jgi:hypothetical protein
MHEQTSDQQISDHHGNFCSGMNDKGAGRAPAERAKNT